jgi:hypothetical protein
LLNESLVSRFDDDWYRNPAAGPWVTKELWAEGQRETAEEIAARVGVGGESLSFGPLLRNIERLLGS